nr:hypothetical protein [Tanacetum cinerariifolium]
MQQNVLWCTTFQSWQQWSSTLKLSEANFEDQSECKDQELEDNVNNTNKVNAGSTNGVNVVSENISNELPFDPDMPALEDISTFNSLSDHEDDDEEADMNNMDTTIQVSLVPTTRIHKDHPFDQVIEDLRSTTQTRNMSKNLEEHEFITTIHQRTNHKDLQNCLFAFFITRRTQKEVKNASTPMETQKPLFKDEDGEEVDVHMYRSMIGSLMYLTSSRPGHPRLGLLYLKDSLFDLVAYTDSDYARASLDRKSTTGGVTYYCWVDVNAVEGFEQTVDFLSANPIKYALTINPTVYTSCIEQFWATVKAKTVNREGQLQALVDGKKILITESTVRKNLQLEDVEGVDCLPNDAIFEQLTLMGFVQVFLNKQLEGMSNHNRIYVLPSHTKKVFRNIRRVEKGFSERETSLFPTMMVQAQEEIGAGSANPIDPHYTPILLQPSTSQPQKTKKPRKPRINDTQVPQLSVPTSVADEAVNEEMDDSLVRAVTTASSLEAEQDNGNINKTQSKATPNESSSQKTDSGVNTPQSNENSLKLKELMELCTTLRSRIIALEQTKATQANEIDSLKRKIKKIKKKQKSRTHKLKRLYKVCLTAKEKSSDDDEDLGENASKQERISDADEGITLVSIHDNAEMFDADKDLHGEEVFVAQQDENVVEKEVDAAQVQVTTVATTPAILIDEVTLAQALLQAELQADFDKEQRLAEERAQQEKEANIALIESWNDVQAKINVYYQLAERLQVEEQQELNDEENATLFMKLLEKMRKFFAAKRAKEKRNKPQIQDQQRKIMCTYLKKMEGKKLTDLKNKSFDSIKKMFDKAFKRVNTFVDFRTELVEKSSKKAEAEVMEESSKRARTKPEQESPKKQKIDDDKEITELQ